MPNRPNILVFMTDQQRGDSVLAGARAKAITPNLDRFAGEGVTFSESFCPSPHCCPSRATFFTGLYPSQHGVWNNVNVGNSLSRGLFEGVRLWSEDLSEAGYQLDYSGKWHVSHHEGPGSRGWVEHFVTANPRQSLPHRPHTHEWDGYTRRGWTHELPDSRGEGELPHIGYPLYTHYGINENPFNDRGVVDDAIQVMHNRSSDDAPWCQYVGTLGPHDAYYVPPRFLDWYRPDDIELPESFQDTMRDKPGFYQRTRDIFGALTEKEHCEAIRHYLVFCSYEDYLFGLVLETLEESGERDNTLVVYTSDHGDYMGDHGLWCKGLPCFRPAYHVPMIMRWPDSIQNPGRQVDAFVSLADIAPTFLEAAGVQVDRRFAGHSLMPFLQDARPADWRDAMFTQSNGNELYGIQRSVRTREYQYVYNGFDYDELYDLRNDPEQIVNLAGRPEHQNQIRELATRLWRFARENEDVCVNPYILVRFARFGPGIAFEE